MRYLGRPILGLTHRYILLAIAALVIPAGACTDPYVVGAGFCMCDHKIARQVSQMDASLTFIHHQIRSKFFTGNGPKAAPLAMTNLNGGAEELR